MHVEREGGLLAWQWRGYAEAHRDRANLLLHMLGVPVFIAGVLAMLALAFRGAWTGAAISAIVAVAGFAVQAVGHRRERNGPAPFRGPADFAARVVAEQFITFPRFVLSGGWLRGMAQPRRD